MIYYIEIDPKTNTIISFGTAEDMPEVLKATKGLFLEITEREYALIVACKGHITKGIYLLKEMKEKIMLMAERDREYDKKETY